MQPMMLETGISKQLRMSGAFAPAEEHAVSAEIGREVVARAQQAPGKHRETNGCSYITAPTDCDEAWCKRC